MSGQKYRQRVISGYLTATGRTIFKPGEFVDWLEDQPEHEAYPAFFGRSDADMARAHRIEMARKMAAGCRIHFNAKMEPLPEPSESAAFTFPAYVSPVEMRKDGGGYVAFDDVMADELLGQADEALQQWLERYGGILKRHGLSIDPVEKVAGGIAKTRAGFALAS